MFELLDAEVQELHSDLGQFHVSDVVVLALVQVVELEAKAFHLGEEVGTRLDKLDVHVLGGLAGRRGGQLHLLLDYLLLLLLQLADEVVGQLKDHCHEVSGHRLVHHVFELDFLADEVHGCTGFAKQTSVELDGFDTVDVVIILV